MNEKGNLVFPFRALRTFVANNCAESGSMYVRSGTYDAVGRLIVWSALSHGKSEFRLMSQGIYLAPSESLDVLSPSVSYFCLRLSRPSVRVGSSASL